MIVLILGGGDLASGVALRLHRAGLKVVITELAQPLAVRRKAAFAEAVYAGETTVEEVTARRVADPTDNLRIIQILAKGHIPVLIDPESQAIASVHPTVVVDARMVKQSVPLPATRVNLLIGLGPGFDAPVNCHAAIETKRGHTLGRVLWQGQPELDTGLPDPVGNHLADRVLRAPADGEVVAHAEIGAHLEPGQPIAEIAGQVIAAPFAGILRGLIHPGVAVAAGLKIGDLDPRDDPRLVSLVSDKALAIGGAVLEAILSRPNLRPHLWS